MDYSDGKSKHSLKYKPVFYSSVIVKVEYKIVKLTLAVKLIANFSDKLSKLKHFMMIITRYVEQCLMNISVKKKKS